MTLLELLRQELPKRGGWPEDADVISTNGYGHVWSYKSKGCISTGKELGIYSSEEGRVTREQYEATSWDGTGLPPVGVECEVSVNGGRSWCTYRATSEKNGARLIEIGNFTEEFQSNNWIFRPLRTEAERAIDEMVRCGVSIGAAKILYDAGYRK